MRRAIAAAVVGGLVLGGAVATPAVAAARGVTKAPAGAKAAKAPKAARRATTAATKTVVYAGYEFQVPASWPVYRLDEHPQTCVRYDVHAVYLGQPGPAMQCPVGVVGRTETVSVIPGPVSVPPAQAGGTDLESLPAVNGVVTQNSAQRELALAPSTGKPSTGATVVGTYGADPAAIKTVLGTLRPAPAGAAATAQAGTTPGQLSTENPGTSSRTELSAEPAKAPSAGPTTSWRGVPAHWPVQVTQPPKPAKSAKSTKPAQPAVTRPVGGFDTCTAPSLHTMQVWRSNYAAAGVYVGGVNAACAPGNLSVSWVQTVVSMNWGLLPTYVGPQAPCWAGTGVKITPAQAAAEGRADGTDAVNRARSFGIGPGSPVYYDMEAYAGAKSCTNAVLQFLGAWDRQVTAAGYLSGVYSSLDSGIDDMQAAATARTPGFTPPDALWIALWDNRATLQFGKLSWPPAERSKQYAGNVRASYGGITLNVDKDAVEGPLAR